MVKLNVISHDKPADFSKKTSLELARSYRERGFAVRPVEFRSKVCRLKDWSSPAHDKTDIATLFANEPSNIGVVMGDLSGGLVDVDLDCPEAVTVAAQMMPPTPFTFGRLRNPGSHWIYRTDNPGQRVAFIDPTTKEMLLEYRANGCYTVFPGSVHESGEEVRFESDSEPARVDRNELLDCLGQVAAASLLARHWPNEGGRHEAALAVAGCLLSGGVEHASTNAFISAICRAAHDEEEADRLECVATTQKRVAAGDPVTAWTALNGVFGDEIANRIRDWLELELARSLVRTNAGALAIIDPTKRNDMANAERFAKEHSHHAAHCHAQKSSYVYDGRRWCVDQHGAMERFAMETARAIARDAADHGDTPDLKWAWHSQSARNIRDMLTLSRPMLAVTQDCFDADPWLLNCRNGTLDLRTGQLRKHDPKDRISKLAPVDYLPGAKCPTWEAFLARIMEGNQNVIGFLQRAIGYTLTGRTSQQCLFLLMGTGANGKSTLLDALQNLLGGYAEPTPMDALMVAKGGTIPNDLARLPGARCAIAVEAEQGRRLAEVKIKQMTGGDRIVARHLYGQLFAYTPQFKLWLATNEKPTITGTNDGIWRRIHLIPFKVTIPPKERDGSLPDQLQTELPGILNWALKGCQEWQSRRSLEPPKEVLAAVQDYRSEMDIVAQFISDCCIKEVGTTVSAKALYAKYSQWCDANGEEPLSKRSFGQRLRAAGVDAGRAGMARGYQGIRLATPAEQLARDVDAANDQPAVEEVIDPVMEDAIGESE